MGVSLGNWGACTFWASTGPVFQSTVWLCTFPGGAFFLGVSVKKGKEKGKKKKGLGGAFLASDCRMFFTGWRCFILVLVYSVLWRTGCSLMCWRQ